ncbi:hypothetical protein [Phytomonospora endophytica]|uniref:D-alanyl-D-alanine carboxypeptidase n=1 Tax=Phytomonospora endophytica TaxID=714109 RepID=A0A841FX59_9ACTN|nr:hypothetical protein [Phytomonospora endophytica]MBB6037937.1 hypothetical protein [Phytomonospora endophytica]GIG68837.1 hypothetical protein Pen01_51320 [Phytomonospora endophytica]
MSVNLTDTDKATIRTAANGAIMLLSFAAGSGSPHKIATAGTLALSSATGPVGHALAEKAKEKLEYKNSATLADQVLPALTESVALLGKQDAAEADNFRDVVRTAVEAGIAATGGEPTPPVAAMVRKITDALDAA